MIIKVSKEDNMIRMLSWITRIKINKIGKIMNKLMYRILLFRKLLKCKSAFWQKQKLKRPII